LSQLAIFDYQSLDAETRIVVQQRPGEIKALVRRSAQDIIEIGQKLIEVKERLPHGQFGPWLDTEFGWKTTTAWNFIQVAIKFSNFEDLDQFAPSALYLLAAPSTPDEARQEALDRAAQGETITHATAKQIVNGYKGESGGQTTNGHKAESESEVTSDLPDRATACPDCPQLTSVR
jgi:hypothetical protein